MKQYWRRPFHFWTDFKRAVEAKQVPEPGWYRFVDKNPPGIYNILGRRPWTKIEFPQDVYRKLYYKDYPLESLLYAHSALPGESKYRQTPMDIFMNRHVELTTDGMDPDLAYLQCQEEKEARDFTQELERHFCAIQAVNFYGTSVDAPERAPGPSPYEKARAAVLKSHRDRLSDIIRLKRDAGGEVKLTVDDLNGMQDFEVMEYIRLHPEDAACFDQTYLFEEDPEATEYSGPPTPTYRTANEPAINRHFLGDYWDPLKWDGKDLATVTNEDLEHLKQDTTKMLDHIAEEMGMDARDDSLYDSLSDQGRFEVLAAWTSAMPDSAQLLQQNFYTSRLQQHLVEYQKTVTDAAQNRGPTAAQRRDPAHMDSVLKKSFSQYSENVSELKSKRAKRTDPLKAASKRAFGTSL